MYFAGNFSVWDPKITTPPGLYLVAYPWLHLLRLPGIQADLTTQLRIINAFGLLGVFWTAWSLADAIRDERRPKDTSSKTAALDKQSTVLTALNAALFPPLFFFSALFYTDVLSALVVLRAHLAFYRKQPIWILFWSLTSLTFRQTNVFWTGVYLGGLEVRRVLWRVNVARHGRAKEDMANDWAGVVKTSWGLGKVYDLEAPGAGAEGRDDAMDHADTD